MALIVKGQLFGTGNGTLNVAENMFLNTTGYVEPATATLPASGGTYTNCSKTGSSIITFSNPASDTTFSFPIYWTQDETTWYTTQITGVLYHSLGTTDITTNGIKTAIGESINTVSGLCQSSKVNRYAQFCPSGSSPYLMGDFRKYAHNTPGGTTVRYDNPSPVVWRGSYTVRAFGSKVFKEITGKPYSATDLQIIETSTQKANTGSLDYNNAYGGYVYYTGTNGYDISTNETWTVKTQHYNGSSWVDGSTATFTLSFLGSPFGVVVTSHTRDADTVYITYTSLAFARGYDFKLTAWRGSNTGSTIQTNSGTPESIEATAPSAFGGTASWKLEVYYNLAYVQVASGTIT